MKNLTPGICLLAIVAIFAACGRRPVMSVNEATWQDRIGGYSNGQISQPNPGVTFLVLSANLDFGAKATLSTDDVSVVSSKGPSYQAIGSDMPPGNVLLTEEEFNRRSITMGKGFMASDSGKFLCKFVFAIPTEAKNQTLGLSYKHGLSVLFSAK